MHQENLKPKTPKSAMTISLTSQTLLLLLLLPSPPPPPPPPSSPLLLPLLLSSALSLRPFRKRKRPPFPRPNPDPSKSTFLMSSSTFHYLLGLLEPLLDCRDPPGSPLPLSPHSRLAAGLLRLASGAPYDHISRLLGVPADAARFCARHLCRVLCTNFRFWLAFPASNADFDSVSVGFLPSLPNCCGAIVCARFEVGGGRAIAAQVVADASSKILGVATGFRGDRDDLEVLRSSSLYKGRVSAPWYLVGGGSYPLLPWLMVPFVDPRAGSSEEDFNAVHRSMCEPALRTVASLRNWGVLSRPIEEDAKMAAAFVGACSILHNVLLMREDYSALSEVGIMEDRPLNDRESGCLLEAFSEEALAIRKELTVKAKEIRGS